MNASSIIETCGRGIPVTEDSTTIVDVCAYLRSTGSPAVVLVSGLGEVKGVLSHTDIIYASGRLGSSVMQMKAADLLRDEVLVCQHDAPITEVLELLTESASDFLLVCEGGTIKGIITMQDVAELLISVLNADAAAETEVEAVPAQGTEDAPVSPAPVVPEMMAQPEMQPQQPEMQQAAQAPLHQPVPQTAAPEVAVAVAFAPVPQPQTAALQAPESPQPQVIAQGWASFTA